MEKAIEIKRRAQKCVQNGDLDGAFREYEKLVETPESDPYNYVLLADLLYKKGEQQPAAERYLDGVGSYEKAGLFKNAIAVCKKMMRLKLSQGRVLRHLAELHALDGLTSEASIYYSQYADEMVNVSNLGEAASALRKAFDNGQEHVKLLEQLSEVLLIDGQNAKAAAALRDAAGHWRTRGQELEARRCHERADKLDPGSAESGTSAGADPAQVVPRLDLPASTQAAGSYDAAPGNAREPGGARDDRPPTRLAEAGSFERSPRFVVPSRPEETAGISDDEHLAGIQQEGVYQIAAGEEETSYEDALQVAATPGPGDPPQPAGTRHSESGLEGVALVENLLQTAQSEFRAGRREQASSALLEAAITYESLGRLDSAATIFRSLGRGTDSPLVVMEHWLANCEKREDRMEGSQVACELGDRALNEGQESRARSWFEHAVGLDPASDVARRRLRRLSATARVSTPAPPVKPPSNESGRIEVSLGRGQAMSFDLGGLLEELQRGVDSQLEGDTQGHYDLGMTYREMGLLDQSVDSFRIAARDSVLAGRAHEMIGRCFSDLGRNEEAVDEFELALRHSTLDADGEAELHIQLATCLAALGDMGGAIARLEVADVRSPGRSDIVERLVDWRRSFRRAA